MLLGRDWNGLKLHGCASLRTHFLICRLELFDKAANRPLLPFALVPPAIPSDVSCTGTIPSRAIPAPLAPLP
jgi:hypothetical protein